MFNLQTNGTNQPKVNKVIQFRQKILELAQHLLLEELCAETVFACGTSFTSRLNGKYGIYETVNGEVVSFQPNPTLSFELHCDAFTIIDELGMIKVVAHHVDAYQLSVIA